jgi:hypothetical protein
MPRYVIERGIPGAGKWSPAELRAVAQKSNAALRELGPDVQWLESHVTDDKIYCVYIGKNPEIVAEHARIAGFPADKISAIRVTIDPTTAEG